MPLEGTPPRLPHCRTLLDRDPEDIRRPGWHRRWLLRHRAPRCETQKKPPQGRLSQVGLGKPKFGKVERSEVDAGTGIEQVEAFQWYRRPFERAVDQIELRRVEVLVHPV